MSVKLDRLTVCSYDWAHIFADILNHEKTGKKKTKLLGPAEHHYLGRASRTKRTPPREALIARAFTYKMAEFDLEVGAAMRLFNGDDGLMPTLQIAGGCQHCRPFLSVPARLFARGSTLSAPAHRRIAATVPSRVR